MGLYGHFHPDYIQYFLLALCAFDLGYFTYYMVAFNLDSERTISDALFNSVQYAVILTFTLAFRMLGVALFFFKPENRRQDGMTHWLIIGYSGVFLTFFGW